jgi:hypothetical protein
LRLSLRVYEVNVADQRFHARHGFEGVAEQPFMIGGTAFFSTWCSLAIFEAAIVSPLLSAGRN